MFLGNFRQPVQKSSKYSKPFSRQLLRRRDEKRRATLRKKCLYSELFWSVFSCIWTEYGRTRITPNTDTFHVVLKNIGHSMSKVMDAKKSSFWSQQWLRFHIWYIVIHYYKMWRSLLQNTTKVYYRVLLKNVTDITKCADFITKSCDVYYKIRQHTALCRCCSWFQKFLGKLIFDDIFNFTEQNNNLFSNSQSGFRSIYSCINQSIKQSVSVFWRFLALVESIYKTWHHSLLYKLENDGINGNPLCLIKPVLHNRHKGVILNGHASIWKPIIAGAPQGSVLGPLFFLVQSNDLPQGLKSNIKSEW